MKNLIKHNQKQLLWKDEIGDTFLILQHGEIFKYSDKVLGVYCWSYNTVSKMRSKRLILNDYQTDDPFYTFYIKIENLAKCMAVLRVPTRRSPRHSKKINKLEKMLGHKIIPYNPTLED